MLAAQLKKCTIMVIGDVIIDANHHGIVDRVAQEAPTPILSSIKTEYLLGGAGNVCSNISAVGAKAYLLSCCGDDAMAELLTEKLQHHQIESYLIRDSARPTTVKHRYYAHNQQLFRMDVEEKAQVLSSMRTRLLHHLRETISHVDAIVISDYGKGLLSKKFIQDIIALAKEHNKEVIIDPKHKDFSFYKNANFVTPNLEELQKATKGREKTIDSIVKASRKLKKKHSINALLVTLSEQGVLLVCDDYYAHFATIAQEVYDVTGAGDTVIAIFSVFVAMGLSSTIAARYANNAGGVVVAKHSTATVSLDEMENLYYSTVKDGQYFTLKEDVSRETFSSWNIEDALHKVHDWKKEKQKIAFTNGCFDLLHDGHIYLLTQIKKMNVRIIIGLNSDSSVKEIKGDTRPIYTQMKRLDLLLGLNIVDGVFLFDEETPKNLIEKIKPDILIKGSDYKDQNIIGKDFVESYGGQVLLMNLLEGHSTSKQIESFKNV